MAHLSVLNLIVFVFSLGMLFHYVMDDVISMKYVHELITVITLVGFFLLSLLNAVAYGTKNGIMGIDLFNGAVFTVLVVTLYRRYSPNHNLSQMCIISTCGLFAIINLAFNILMQWH